MFEQRKNSLKDAIVWARSSPGAFNLILGMGLSALARGCRVAFFGGLSLLLLGNSVVHAQSADGMAQERLSTHRADLVTLLTGWSEAWSQQRIEDYLGYYSAQFVSPGQLDFAAWQRQRRQRLRRPQFVEVAVAILDVEMMSEDRATLRFLQRYRSDRYRDVVTKTLVLVREGDDWKILREMVEEE